MSEWTHPNVEENSHGASVRPPVVLLLDAIYLLSQNGDIVSAESAILDQRLGLFGDTHGMLQAHERLRAGGAPPEVTLIGRSALLAARRVGYEIDAAELGINLVVDDSGAPIAREQRRLRRQAKKTGSLEAQRLWFGAASVTILGELALQGQPQLKRVADCKAWRVRIDTGGIVHGAAGRPELQRLAELRSPEAREALWAAIAQAAAVQTVIAQTESQPPAQPAEAESIPT